jgi:hypothetical protein
VSEFAFDFSVVEFALDANDVIEVEPACGGCGVN